ncbi:AAA family ATPase [Snodgrassella sp.]|uniref:AAA family ATPase n=1 Tax=Snodgrassella sp. TaxID=2815304 RepID=UPI00258C2BF7|nr:AAA family ATPase [Snodgrassella sp.]MCO6517603.1 AAA family ATPase [Snodgrassella sp.]
MYLQSFTIKNFRKFGEHDNEVMFVNSKEICHNNSGQDIPPLVSPSSTLIIGKNNTGKTTITHALTMLTNNKLSIKSSDFNLSYLNNLIDTYIAAYQNKDESPQPDLETPLETPKLEFELKIKLDNPDDEYIHNLSQFMLIGNGYENAIIIKAIYEVKEEANFFAAVKTLVQQKTPNDEKVDKRTLLEEILKLLDDKNQTEFKLSYKNKMDQEVKNFSLDKLLEINCIKANRHLNENVLTSVFKRIVISLFSDEKSDGLFNQELKEINDIITEKVEQKNKSISEILREIEQLNHIDMKLSGNVTKDDILDNLIKYSFSDGDSYIPEDQFGLGYINLVNIIGEIIDYINSYEENCHRSRINLLLIEEPEAFMHPQMQEFFIKRIDLAVNKAIQKESEGNPATPTIQSLKCQIVITTHSSHIVNSKIHSSNSFDNINYLTTENRCSKVIPLYDELLTQESSQLSNSKSSQKSDSNNGLDDDKLNPNDLLFLKKHIKYKVSELFFSDAIILVEGRTEEILLNYFLENDKDLKKYYISIFGIDGAYGKVYVRLIQQLKIPCLLITDIDIERFNCEKSNRCKNSCPKCKGRAPKSKNIKQITSLVDRKTTNNTLKYLHESYDLHENMHYTERDNIYFVFQKDQIEGQYATSLEEAIILTNHNNYLIINLLKEFFPKKSKNFIIKNKIKCESSYEIQQQISQNCGKTEFASMLLYKMIISDEKSSCIQLPSYIDDGLKWLKNQLANHHGEKK